MPRLLPPQGGASIFRGTSAIPDWAASRPAYWPEGLETLLVSGEHDFVTPACVSPWLDIIPRSRCVGESYTDT